MLEKILGLRIFGGKEAIELLALRIQQDHRGKSLDFIFLCERFVFIGECLVGLWEIKLDEDEIFRRRLDEFFF